jgi:hypothetical protein
LVCSLVLAGKTRAAAASFSTSSSLTIRPCEALPTATKLHPPGA